MYFVAKPNPVEYGKLVKLSYSAIKGVDPGAKLILGGLFSRPSEANLNRKPPLAYFAADFLEKLYAGSPGIKRMFQGVAIHPYTATYKRLEPYVEEIREVLKKNHDAAKGLWLTELGWSSQHPARNNSFAKGKSGQATQLRGAFRVIESRASKWHLQRVYWFSVDDHTGLLQLLRRLRPVRQRLQAEARLERLRGVRRRHALGNPRRIAAQHVGHPHRRAQ